MNKPTTNKYKDFSITKAGTNGLWIVRLPSGQFQTLQPSLTLEDITSAIDKLGKDDNVIPTIIHGQPDKKKMDK